MKRWVWLPLILLTGCGPAVAPEPKAEFATDPQGFCQSLDQDWLMHLVARLQAAAPAGVNVQFQQLMVEPALVDGQLRNELNEVQLRVINGGESLAAYGIIDPATCKVGPMEVYAPLRLLDGAAPRFVAP